MKCFKKVHVFLWLVLLPALSYAQTNITGAVTDATGETIIGANVVEKGTRNSTVTDVSGKFSLTVAEGAVLQVSYLGYVTQEVVATPNMTVVLAEDTKTLDEVVVVGYGVQRKRDLTGSISQVKGDEMRNLPQASITGAIAGRVSGVDFVSGGGAPGSKPTIRIRGTGTFNSSDPLIVIDGIVAGDMSQYNPNDVESVEILKDASAAAIYGTRAANGVILITTKRGQASEKPNISVNMYAGVSNLMKRIDVLQAPALAMLKKEAYTNSSSQAQTQAGDLYRDYWNNPANAVQRQDWQDAHFTTGSVYNADITIKGGSNRHSYYSNFGYYKDDGIIKPAEFTRYSIRLNSNHEITKWLKIGENFQYSLINQERTNTPPRDALRYDPSTPIYNSDGTWGSVSYPPFGAINNPVMLGLTETHDRTTRHSLQGNITLDIELINGLFLKGNYGVNANIWKTYNFAAVVKGQPYGRAEAELGQGRYDEYQLTGETYLSYYKEFANAHVLNISAGFSAEKYRGEELWVRKTGYSDEAEDQRTISNGQKLTFMNGGWFPESALASWFGRMFYSFRNKYLLTVTARTDGSSRFPENKRWGFFPAFSAGWRISEEAFMEGVSFLDNLKLTGGWGSMGNQSIGNFMYLSTIQKGGGSWNMYNFGGTQTAGSVLNQLGNMAITWERTNMLNLALEAGFLKNKLNVTLTYFDKNTVDMLLPAVTVGTLGKVGIPPSNIGEVNNHGLEMELSFDDKTANGLAYQIGFNATYLKNKVTKLYDNNDDSYIAGPNYSNITAIIVSRTYAGDPIGSFYGWKTEGIYQNQQEINNDPYLRNDANRAFIQPGDVRFMDINNDGKIDENDQVNLGDPNPSVLLGLNGTVTYKGFDLSANFTASLGFKIYNVDKMEGLNSSLNFNMYAEAMDRWHGEGTGNNIPRIVLPGDDRNNNYRASDLFVENGDFLMLRNLTIGYTLPKSIVSKIGLQNLRVYVSGQNLFTLTCYSGLTPELAYSSGVSGSYPNRGIDVAEYPVTRIFSGGITIDF
jgi:TonB-linked SusC/RagA family outer membrane protein